MTVLLNNSRERTRFLKFAVVGTIGAVVDFGVMNVLRRLCGVPLTLAGTVSFIAAVLSNFTWNRYWTYPDSRSKPVARQLLEFGVVNVMGLAIRYPILWFGEPLLLSILKGLPLALPLSPVVLADNITLATAVVIVMFWNFFVNRYWTYSDVS